MVLKFIKDYLNKLCERNIFKSKKINEIS